MEHTFALEDVIWLQNIFDLSMSIIAYLDKMEL